MDNRLVDIAKELRIDIAKMFYISGTGHMAPALSCVDIFTELYFDGIINFEKRFSDDRDRVILSKGHACAALYAVLAKVGYFSREELWNFYQNGSVFGGHPSPKIPGVEAATGALGHGICFGTGTAMAAQLDKRDYRTYVIMGDGESQEGSVWEAVQFAGKEKLNKLIVIMDCNGLQASDYVDKISLIEPVKEKWISFGWNVYQVSGHDYKMLHDALAKAHQSIDKPSLILAETVKGKGISIAENNSSWHSRAPKGDEWNIVCKDLGISRSELEKV